jgi:hypothetical protein
MSALLFHKDRRPVRVWIGITIDHRVSFFGSSPRFFEDRLIFKRNLWRWQFIHLVAGDLAGATPNATGEIGKNAKSIRVAGKISRPVGQLGFADQTRT